MKVAVLLLICSMLLVSAEKNPWQGLFTDHLEKVYVIMRDKTIFEQSNQDEVRVPMSVGLLKKRLESKGYSIKEIEVVIHNHRRSKNFTRADYKQHRMLKSYGFDGLFLLYCHRTNETYNIEGGKDAKKT